MTPLVLVHGFMGGSAQWAHLTELLSDEIETIAIDLPGFGLNAHLNPIDSIEGYADWIIAHLSEAGVGAYDLLGHSMGGMIVQDMARKDDRIRRLVLYATGAAGVLPGRFETIATSKRRAEQDGARATARRISATWFRDREEATDYEACAEIAAGARIEAIHAGLSAMEAWSGETRLDQIRQETLLIWGEYDRTYSWAQTYQLWQGIPNAHPAVLPGCAHAVHFEKPALFHALLLEFLRPDERTAH